MRNRSRIMVSMNRLSTEKRAQIIGCLVEGNSIRATVRMTGAAKNTITKLLVDIGEACADYQDGFCATSPARWSRRRDLGLLLRQEEERPRAVQRDPRLRRRLDVHGDLRRYEAGPVLAGRRADRDDAYVFLCDLASRMADRIQLTTDGHTRPTKASRSRPSAIRSRLGADPEDLRAPPEGERRNTARPSASGTKTRVLKATPTPTGSQRATSSGRTSRCGWGCGASRG